MTKLNFILATSLLGLAACSTKKPKEFEKMDTVDEMVNKYDQKTIKNGMAVTKEGAVVDIKVQDVQSQKRNLEARVEYMERLVDAYEHDIKVLKDENADLRAKNKAMTEAKSN